MFKKQNLYEHDGDQHVHDDGRNVDVPQKEKILSQLLTTGACAAVVLDNQQHRHRCLEWQECQKSTETKMFIKRVKLSKLPWIYSGFQ